MSDIDRSGLPAGTVTNTPLGQAALQRIAGMTLQPGESADALHGRLNNFDSKLASFREDYRVPSLDPNDTSKMEAYSKENKSLLSKHKWMPNIKALLEGEIKATNKTLTTLKDGIKLETDMKGAELNKLKAEAKSKLMKKKTAAARDYNRMAQEAIPDLNSAADKIDATLGHIWRGVKNFGMDVHGRHNDLYALNRELGHYEGLASMHAPGSIPHGVNSKLVADKAKAIQGTHATVRRARANAVVGGLGLTGIGLSINDEIERRSQYKYASIIPGSEDTHTTLQLSTDRGSISGDAFHALTTLDNDPSYAKHKLLAATAVAAVSAAAGLYGAHRVAAHPEFKHMMTASQRSGIELGKVVAEVMPYVTGAGGLYYAHQNKDNATKRNIGLGVAGASVGARLLARKMIPFTPVDTSVLGKEHALLAGGMYSMVGGIGYMGHKGQEIANAEAVEHAMHSDMPIEDVTRAVNTVRGKHSLAMRYPVTRYLNIPRAITKVVNQRMGKPAGSMSGDDLAYYREAQIDKEFDTLKRRYEANMGRLNHAGHTDLRQMAIDKVDGRA